MRYPNKSIILAFVCFIFVFEASGQSKIFLTPERLIEMRTKASSDHENWSYMESRLSNYLTTVPYNSWTYAAAYALSHNIEENPVYLQRAKELFDLTFIDESSPKYFNYTSRNGFRREASTGLWSFNWLFDHWTPTEKTIATAKIKDWATYWVGYVNYPSFNGYRFEDSDETTSLAENFLLLAICLEQAGDPYAATVYDVADHMLNEFVVAEFMNDYMKGGLWAEGSFYSVGTMPHFIRTFLVNKELRNINYPTSYMNDVVEGLAHTIYPGRTGVFQYGDNESTYVLPYVSPNTRYDLLLQLTEAVDATFEKGIAQGMLNDVINEIGRPVGTGHTGILEMLFENLIRTNEIPVSNLPTSYYAEGLGFVAMRSDWSAQASTVYFQNSRPNVDHQQYDALAFCIVNAGKNITKEMTGYVGVGETGTAHNTLLIQNASSDGSSSPTGRPQGQGTTSLIDDNDSYGYIKAEAAPIYNMSGYNADTYVDHVQRKLIYLKPDIVIVGDYIDVVDARGPRWKKYIQHFQSAPQYNTVRDYYYTESEGQNFYFKTLLPVSKRSTIVDESDLWAGEPTYQSPPSQRKWHISVSPTNDQNEEYFVNVLNFGTHNQMYENQLLTTSTDAHGVSILHNDVNHIVVFSKKDQIVNEVMYQTENNTLSKEHLVLDLEPGTYTIEFNGNPILSAQTTVNGSLVFSTNQPGSYKITNGTAASDTEIPSTPNGLSAFNTSETSLDLSWGTSIDNIGVTNYKVYRDGIEIGVTGATTQYNDSGLTSNTTYAYTVSALDAAGNESAQSNIVNVTTLEDTTGPPPGLASFPGAQGYGAQATGGRGGQVIHVTNLNANGPGSLNAAVQTSGPRIIVFDVGGEIAGDITITEPNVTIAGETAPSPGITINGKFWAAYNENVNNIIVRFLRIRPDNLNGNQGDAVQFSLSDNLIFDHVNVSWGSDEAIDFYEAKNVTLQYCFIEESATFANHPDGNFHNYGMINGPNGRYISVHHNLFAHHNHRTPAIANGPADIINNVVYNSTTGFVHHNPANDDCFNFIGNYYRTGPNRNDINPFWLDDETVPNNAQYYMSGNYVDDTIGPETYQDFLDDPWNSTYEGVSLFASGPGTAPEQCASTNITITTAAGAYTDVLARAGSFPRDVVALRTVDEVKNRTGSWGREVPLDLMAGLPNEPTPIDTDNDGMPNTWETTRGLNPNVADNNGDDDSDGYTNIEEYLHYRVNQLLNVAPDNEAPSIPVNLVVSDVGVTAISLSWDVSIDNIGVSGYNVYRNGVLVVNSVSTNYEDTGLTASTTYNYTISALDAAGNESTQSTVIAVTTDTTTTLPIGELPLRIDALFPAQYATGVSTTTDLIIDLEGVVISNQQYSNGSFRLYTFDDQDTPVFEYNFLENGSNQWSGNDIVTFDIPDLQPNTEYIILAEYGWIRTDIGSAGGFRTVDTPWDGNRKVWKFTTGINDSEAPSVPIGLSVSNVTTNSIDINWTVSTDDIGVAGYKVFRDGIEITNTIDTNYTDTQLESGTTYSYVISAVDAAGNESTKSDAITATTGTLQIGELPLRIDALFPAQYATGVSTTTDLIIDLEGVVISNQQYSNGSFRLYAFDDQDTPVFEYNFLENGSNQWSGNDIVTFDIPDLQPNTEYIILAEYGWIRTDIGSAGGFRTVDTPWDVNRKVWKFTTGETNDAKFENTKVNIYPNPFYDILRVELPLYQNENIRVDVYTLAGILIHSKNYLFLTKNITIDTSDLAESIYIVKITSKRIRKNFKIIRKEKN